DFQNGRYYLVKVLRFAFRGYRLNVHVNGMSKKGYILALIAVLAGRLVFHPTLVTFHGGIACDSAEIKQAIVGYGIRSDKVSSIATFSSQYLSFAPAKLSPEIERFLSERDPVFFSYVSFRAEYRLEVLREG